MQKMERNYRRWKENNKPYRIAFVLAIVVFMICAPEVNDGSAMAPTLNDGDALIVSKTTYNPKRKPPEKDTIIIMEKTYAPEVSEDNIIARVVAQPRDTVEIKNGKVLVNGEEYVTGNGIKGAPKDMKKIKLKNDEVFLLCDNRKVYIDSRNPDLGPVDIREIKGDVIVKVWPLSEFKFIKSN